VTSLTYNEFFEKTIYLKAVKYFRKYNCPTIYHHCFRKNWVYLWLYIYQQIFQVNWFIIFESLNRNHNLPLYSNTF